MTDIRELFERYAREQKSLKDLSWPEKVRLVARLRLEIIALRRKEKETTSGETPTR